MNGDICDPPVDYNKQLLYYIEDMYSHFKDQTVIIVISALILFSLCISAYATGKPSLVVIKEGDEWHYFKGTSEPPEKWYYRDFDDSTWLKGSSGFGYGVGKHNTLLDDMKGQYQSVYVRREFTVLYHNRIKSIVLSVKCDGPFVAYLNMIEAIRSNRPSHGDPLILSGFGHELDPGTNVLSIQCSNDDINSASFSFIPFFELIEE